MSDICKTCEHKGVCVLVALEIPVSVCEYYEKETE